MYVVICEFHIVAVLVFVFPHREIVLTSVGARPSPVLLVLRIRDREWLLVATKHLEL